MISVFDLFRVGLGPSSSHTVGPMRAARSFLERLDRSGRLGLVARVRVELYGSLAATGRAHGTDTALLLGLSGERPESVDPDSVQQRVAEIRRAGAIELLGRRRVELDERHDLLWHRRERLAAHPNGMRFAAFAAGGETLGEELCFSVGGGFVAGAAELAASPGAASPGTPPGPEVPYPFASAQELLAHCAAGGLTVSGVVLANETTWRGAEELRAGLLERWAVMRESVRRGCSRPGELPGFLRLRRRAPGLAARLSVDLRDSFDVGAPPPGAAAADPLVALDALDLFALAVSEENAAGGRIVTAPTNGAAGIVPAVLEYYARFVHGASTDGVLAFLLAAGAIGMLCKQNASISGAEVGCQGEVGSASAMAAAGLCELLGGSPRQVENAAEIAVEHNLGLTCDPVGGLVQVPCIERNAMGAVKAVNAARIALAGDGSHVVSLDNVLLTMRRTGADMSSKYKETSRGGLAVSIPER